MRPNKVEIINALRAGLADELASLERVAAMSREDAVSEESKSENEYDTRSTEASYLARGLGRRIKELRQVVAWFEVFDARKPLVPLVVQTGALVQLDGASEELLFLAPVGGGRYKAGPWTVQIVSPSSPLGEALCELAAGDEAEFDTPRGLVTREILSVG